MDRLLIKARNTGVEAEITTVDTEVTPLRFESGNLMESNNRRLRETALRIIDNGKLGTVEGTGSTPVDQLWEAARISASYGTPGELAFPATRIHSDQYSDPRLEEMTPEAAMQYSTEILERMKEKNPRVPVDLTLTREVITTTIRNTAGGDCRSRRTAFRVWIQGRVPGSKVGVIKESARWKMHSVDETLLDELAEEYDILDKPLAVKSGPMPVLFTSASAWSLIYRYYQGVNGDNINKGISPLTEKLGQSICSELLTLRDDPFQGDGWEARPFDDEGVAIQPRSVIENGVLKNFIFDLKTGLERGTGSTGNGFRKATWTEGIQYSPNPHFASMVTMPGTSTREELIQSMKEGIIVDYVLGFHSGNMVNGDFSMNLGVGYVVRDGELVGRAMDTMVAGNIHQDFQYLDGVSNRLDKSFKGYCPALRFSQMNVAGTE